MMKTIKVSDKGQIAIPQPMRENLGIERGGPLYLGVYHKVNQEKKLLRTLRKLLSFSKP